MNQDRSIQEQRFRRIFLGLHADHMNCASDEWLMQSCRLANGEMAARPIVWSRRNGPWRNVDVLWVGAAPGNDGGRGSGLLGAHGTRIPFGGDISGANLEVMLGSIGLNRNDTFIAAALNQLPDRGGGEPTTGEILAPQGDFTDSVALLRATIIAAAPRLIVALGNVAARVIASAWTVDPGAGRILSLAAIRSAGWARHATVRLASFGTPSRQLVAEWQDANGDRPDPVALWLTHPSAQNMSPHAGVDTVFHARMLESLDVLRGAVSRHLGWTSPGVRPEPSGEGIYALPEWRERISQRTMTLDRLWREKDV